MSRFFNVLRWRIILGSFLVALSLTLCWFDAHAQRPGIYLVLPAVVLCLLATQEMLRLFHKLGQEPTAWTIYLGTLLPLLGACVPIAWTEYPSDCPVGRLGWLACGLAAGLIVAVVSEIWRYRQPGSTIVNLALAALSILYVGGLMGFLIQLRLLDIGSGVSRGGLLAMISTVVVVKAADTGAYTAGNLWGSHKMAPVISPSKTWEGLLGGLALAVVGALLTLGPLARALGCESDASWSRWLIGTVAYGLVVSGAGVFGDLAESLLKRDAGVKDSSSWLPGLGGVLDLLDSLLVAAPVAYLFWVTGLVGP